MGKFRRPLLHYGHFYGHWPISLQFWVTGPIAGAWLLHRDPHCTPQSFWIPTLSIAHQPLPQWLPSYISHTRTNRTHSVLNLRPHFSNDFSQISSCLQISITLSENKLYDHPTLHQLPHLSFPVLLTSDIVLFLLSPPYMVPCGIVCFINIGHLWSEHRHMNRNQGLCHLYLSRLTGKSQSLLIEFCLDSNPKERTWEKEPLPF